MLLGLMRCFAIARLTFVGEECRRAVLLHYQEAPHMHPRRARVGMVLMSSGRQCNDWDEV